MPEKQDTHDQVIKIVCDKLKVDKPTVESAKSFEELGADSLDMVEIVMKLEDQFNIQINDEDAEKLTSIQEVVGYVHNLREK